MMLLILGPLLIGIKKVRVIVRVLSAMTRTSAAEGVERVELLEISERAETA